MHLNLITNQSKLINLSIISKLFIDIDIFLFMNQGHNKCLTTKFTCNKNQLKVLILIKFLNIYKVWAGSVVSFTTRREQLCCGCGFEFKITSLCLPVVGDTKLW